ncbi:MAG: deoxynucleoside kinase [Clostridia bacterium]|nr:deoxynucleoside kinase [Clostridia bacterium]
MGRLLVIDGLDGSGKGTHSKLVAAKLNELGIPAERISFPDYDSPSSALLQMYLHGEFGTHADDVNAYAASVFFAADRFAGFRTKYQKLYDDGVILVADRYTTSNIVHQMSKLPKDEWDGFIEWLSDFEYGKLELPRPDAVIYLDMKPEISQALIERRYRGDLSKKDIHELDVSYLQKSRDCALYVGEQLGWRMTPMYDEAGVPRSKQENFEIIFEQVKEIYGDLDL